MVGAPDAADDDLAAFAADLRVLRKAAGFPTFGELATGRDVSARAFSDAVRGERFPTWAVVAAYVEACGGDPEAWRARYAALAGPRRLSQLRLARSVRLARLPTRRVVPSVSGSVLVSLLLVAVAVLGVAALHRGGAGSGGSGSAAAGPTSGDASGGDNANAGPPPAQPAPIVPKTATTPGALIKRAGSPEVSVFTGSARITYTSWDDLVAGYGAGPSIVTVSDAYYDALSTVPVSGTLIKEAGKPDIAEVVGSARSTFPSWSALVTRYGPAPQFVVVPTYFFDRMNKAPGSA